MAEKCDSYEHGHSEDRPVDADSCATCLRSELAQARERAAELESIVQVVVEINPEPCWKDHHGLCQEHNLEKDCHVARAKAIISRPSPQATAGNGLDK